MLTQEEYVNGVLALRRQGMTIAEIAEELDYHPATISKWLRSGEPPPARTIDPAERVIDGEWATRTRQLIRPPADKLLATSVFEIIAAEGFDGSYPTVVRFLRWAWCSTASRCGTRSTSTPSSPGCAPRGHPVRDEDLARLSPYMRRHLNVHGHYSFQLPELAGSRRALRDPAGAADDAD